MTISPFDASTKKGWLSADLNGLFYTWMMTLLVYLFIACSFAAMIDQDTWTMVILTLKELYQTLCQLLGFMFLAALSMLPAFVIVFVLRYNFTVIGEKRKFRYISRWL